MRNSKPSLEIETFATLDGELLATATGGSPPPPPPPDFADRYVSNIQTDVASVDRRIDMSAQALVDENWREAGKQYGAAYLNALGLIGDTIAPLRAIFG